MSNLPTILSVDFFISEILVIISRSMIWAFLFISCLYLFNLSSSFLNIWHTVIINVLMSLSANSSICFHSGFTLIGSIFIHIMNHIFLLLCIPANFDWMPIVKNFTLSGAGYFCISIHPLKIRFWMQLSNCETDLFGSDFSDLLSKFRIVPSLRVIIPHFLGKIFPECSTHCLQNYEFYICHISFYNSILLFHPPLLCF